MSENIFSKYQTNFDENMKKSIVEAAVSVYGEACRSMIEERINRIVIIQYITPEDIKHELNRIFSDKRDELTLKFLKSQGFSEIQNVNETDEQMKEVLRAVFDWIEFSESDWTPIHAFDRDKNERGNLEDRCKVLDRLGIKGITPENYETFENTKEGKEKLAEINQILENVKGLVLEFNEYKAQFEPDERYFSECKSLQKTLNMDAIREYFSELKSFLPLEDKKRIEEALSLPNDVGEYKFFSVAGEKYVRYSDIQRPSYIEAFDGEELDYKRENGMVSYFKSQGLNLGYNYSDYKDSDEAKKIIPPPELVKKVKELRGKYGRKVSKELFLKTGTIPFDIEKIESLGLIGESEFSMEFVEEGVTAVVPNARVNNEGKVENINLLFLPPLKGLKDYKEVQLIHEILHCLEGSIQEIDGDYVFSTGFEKISIEAAEQSIDIDKSNEHNIRKYEKFSENIHQRLAMEVYENLRSSGTIIFPQLEAQKVRGGTSYEQLSFVTNEFYSEFKQQITYARMTGNIERLLEHVGKENFEQLNGLVSEYDSLPYYSMMNDVINKKESPLVVRRNEIGEAAHNIVFNMTHARESHDRA